MNGSLFTFPRGIGDLMLWLVPIGTGHDWWGDESDVPRGYIIAAGQDIEQSKFPRLYAKWCKSGVHRFGAGSTATSTKAPDKRGRASVGKDDMGGTAASRITSGVSGVNGTTLGAAGGDERLHQHSHTPNDPTHAHTERGTNQDGYPPNLGPPGANSGSALANANFTTLAASTGITLQNAGAGASQNLPPSIVCNYIIRAG